MAHLVYLSYTTSILNPGHITESLPFVYLIHALPTVHPSNPPNPQPNLLGTDPTPTLTPPPPPEKPSPTPLPQYSYPPRNTQPGPIHSSESTPINFTFSSYPHHGLPYMKEVTPVWCCGGEFLQFEELRAINVAYGWDVGENRWTD